MAKLKYLVIHCTDTPAAREVTRKDLEQWHLRENGWKQLGYSDIIHLDGSLENLVDWNQDGKVDSWEVTNGAKGYNGVSRHVVYAGGKGGDTRTEAQIRALKGYVLFHILRYPDIKVIGHCHISDKSCPAFDVEAFCREIEIPEKNIGL